MTQCKIYAGLGGGFGGAQYQYTDYFESIENAKVAAWEAACDEYDSYLGTDDGLRTVDQIMEDESCDYEEAFDIFFEERESWLDYWAEEIE
jgi:hypothetical protein